MSSTQNFLDVISNRRTIYDLKPELPNGAPVGTIQHVVHTIVKETPTAFNSQVNRAVILLGDAHKKVWEHVAAAMPTPNAKARPLACQNEAYGCVVFLTDDKTTADLQAQFPSFAGAFPSHADTSSGAVQIEAWAALESLGCGCNLQHYNALVREALPADVPKGWSVHSQLVFGLPVKAAPAKTYIDNEVRIYT
ncbi:uncharacterized protein KNAG_0C00580 [Huiozyma naganishii CBS 8797]|uniref:Nitroreductase domain-containing protein n=1 Tax=Huiozyma naganishii (strain ATCC MYA-139 / BCRC 22969 / CBS 8797 / KCTC 17520 / NBRC 10181 / NCYC 3082 / Yp74L-3) TaxID=1071383 RepID=J7RW24_HUIN7|nr:hypothetical protein KNAG_0C00580 [Kazachstania naganishii CBS 8797]CCK69172.1 hypothetical protein KNAG_0C00580 [Kazachstania naganishii CBS 8797]